MCGTADRPAPYDVTTHGAIGQPTALTGDEVSQLIGRINWMSRCCTSIRAELVNLNVYTYHVFIGKPAMKGLKVLQMSLSLDFNI